MHDHADGRGLAVSRVASGAIVNASVGASAGINVTKLDFGTALALLRTNSAGNGAQWAPAGQIAFPATQNASADGNTLDDYEKGTWTMIIGGSGGTSGQTYSNQTGVYTKIGRDVAINGYVALTAKGTITGGVQLQGLPFAIGGSSSYAMGAMWWTSLATNWVYLAAQFVPGGSGASVRGLTAAGTSSDGALATADITNTTAFMVGGGYAA